MLQTNNSTFQFNFVSISINWSTKHKFICWQNEKQDKLKCGLPNIDPHNQVASLVMFYQAPLVHLPVHDQCTCTPPYRFSQHLNSTLRSKIQTQNSKVSQKTRFFFFFLIQTNQSFEVIHNSSRFTTPSSNSFFKADPIYNQKRIIFQDHNSHNESGVKYITTNPTRCPKTLSSNLLLALAFKRAQTWQQLISFF